MPAVAPNNLLAVEQTLWSIAIAWPGLTGTTPPLMKIGNRIRFDQLGIPWPEAKQARRPADEIEFKLDVPGTGRPDPRAPRTFCFQPDVTVYEAVWTLTAATQQLNALTQAHAELKAAMVAAGTQLGIPLIVARWEHEMRPGRAKDLKDRQILWVQRVTVKG